MKKNFMPMLFGAVLGVSVCFLSALILFASTNRSVLSTQTLSTRSIIATITSSRTPSPTRTHRPTSTPKYGTMDNPIGFGEHANLTMDNLDSNEKILFGVSIVSVIRGQESLDVVMNENPYNEIPPDGMEYIVFVAEISHTGNDNNILNVNDYHWGVLTNGEVFDWSFSVCCFDGVKLAKGGMADETVALLVYVDDDDPLLIFGERFYFSSHD